MQNNQSQVSAAFVAELVVHFKLPGAEDGGHGNMNGAEYQLSSRWNESWTIKVNADNALETAAVFRAVAAEIERVHALK
jgi:hypothetical protein